MINKITQIKKIPSSPAEAMKGYPETNTKNYIILEHFQLGRSINKYETLLSGQSCLSATIYNMCVVFRFKVSRLQEKAKDLADTKVRATNNEQSILKIARNRAGLKLSRSYVKSLLDKYTGKYWNVEYLEGDNNAIYTNKLIFDFSDEYYNLEGE